MKRPPCTSPTSETVALGTAGALGALLPWLDGRDVMVTNADALVGARPGRDRVRGRLGSRAGPAAWSWRPADGRTSAPPGTAGWRSCRTGSCARWAPNPAASTRRRWRAEWEAGRLDLVETEALTVDCGTPGDYLRANLVWSGGGSVIDPGGEGGPTVRSSTGRWCGTAARSIDGSVSPAPSGPNTSP